MIQIGQAEYQIELARDDGTTLAELDTTGAFEYIRVANNVGFFSVQLPANFDQRLIARDRRIVFSRRAQGGILRHEFQGLIRRPITQGASLTRILQGYDFNYLLDRRSILYAAGTSQASVTGYADDLMKNAVAQNMGASAAAGRQFNSTYFSVAANVSGGPSITLSFAWHKLIDVLIALGRAARTAGTDVYFDIETVDNAAVQFRTYINQRGTNRTTTNGINPVVFGIDRGNLIDPKLIEDGTDEANAITVTGQGQGTARNTVTRTDTTRTTQSLWAYAEDTIDRRDLSTTAALNAAGDAELIARRVSNQFTATLLSVPGSIYGLDWYFGDKVTVSYAGRQFDAMIRAIHVSVDENKREAIEATLEAYL